MENQDNKIFLNKLEELNKQYLESGYYTFGQNAKYIFSLIKRAKFITLFFMYKAHIKKEKYRKNVKKDDTIIRNITEPLLVHSDEKRKIVVYTCITGNYDKVQEPLVQEDSCKYILFTNNAKIKSNCWEIRAIPEKILELKDNAKINRYIKFHPKELLEEFDYSIYVDGNIKLVSDISTFINNINPKSGLAIHRHSAHDCIYDEVEYIIGLGKGNKKGLKKQIKRYKKDGFPKHYGMFQCNVLVSDLKNKSSEKIFEQWWNEYENTEGKRDQVSFPYILWKNNIKEEDIGNLGNDIYKNYKLMVNTHI